MNRELTRRELLFAGGAGGAALGASALLSRSLTARALAGPPRCGSPEDIEHVVILIQENRSFDHYFGTYRGVAGFGDPGVLPLPDGSGLSIFAQPGYPGGFQGDHLHPFHLDSSTTASAPTTSTTAGVASTRAGPVAGSIASSGSTSRWTER